MNREFAHTTKEPQTSNSFKRNSVISRGGHFRQMSIRCKYTYRGKYLDMIYYIFIQGAVNLDAITDPAEREALEGMIQNFGQVNKISFYQGYYYKDEQSMIIWKIGSSLDFDIISFNSPFGCTPALLKPHAGGQLPYSKFKIGKSNTPTNLPSFQNIS